MLEFNGFQPILKYRHYTLKPNELTDQDIQIMNLPPFKEKKRSSQYKVYDVLTLTIIGDLHFIVLKRNLLLSLQCYWRSCAIYDGHETRDKKTVISVSHVFMKGGYTACHAIAQFYDFLIFRLSFQSFRLS